MTNAKSLITTTCLFLVFCITTLCMPVEKVFDLDKDVKENKQTTTDAQSAENADLQSTNPNSENLQTMSSTWMTAADTKTFSSTFEEKPVDTSPLTFPETPSVLGTVSSNSDMTDISATFMSTTIETETLGPNSSPAESNSSPSETFQSTTEESHVDVETTTLLVTAAEKTETPSETDVTKAEIVPPKTDTDAPGSAKNSSEETNPDSDTNTETRSSEVVTTKVSTDPSDIKASTPEYTSDSNEMTSPGLEVETAFEGNEKDAVSSNNTTETPSSVTKPNEITSSTSETEAPTSSATATDIDQSKGNTNEPESATKSNEITGSTSETEAPTSSAAATDIDRSKANTNEPESATKSNEITGSTSETEAPTSSATATDIDQSKANTNEPESATKLNPMTSPVSETETQTMSPGSEENERDLLSSSTTITPESTTELNSTSGTTSHQEIQTELPATVTTEINAFSSTSSITEQEVSANTRPSSSGTSNIETTSFTEKGTQTMSPSSEVTDISTLTPASIGESFTTNQTGSETSSAEFTSPDAATDDGNGNSTSTLEGLDICMISVDQADNYIDDAMTRMRSRIPEPAKIPNRSGRFSLLNGNLQGLSTIYRTAPSGIYCQDESVYFKIPAGTTHLHANYDWTWTAFFRTFQGTVLFGVNDFEVDTLYSAFKRSDGSDISRLRLRKFNIVKMNGIHVKFTGLGPLNRLASGFTQILMRVFQRSVSRAIEKPIQDAINKELIKYDEKNTLYLNFQDS